MTTNRSKAPKGAGGKAPRTGSAAPKARGGPQTSRRTVLAGLGLAGLGGAGILSVLANQPGAADAAPERVKDWLRKPGGTPFEIPLDFMGLHSDHGVSNQAPPPTYPYDAIRSHDVDNGHDQPATQWADIEVAPGKFDWRLTDKWFETHVGKTLIWVLFGCPAFYQKYPGEPFTFPDRPGGGSPPRDPQMAANFVSELLARYPDRIDFLEIWNEPNFGPGTDPLKDRWTPDLGDAGWFTGTAGDLAEMARVVRGVLPAKTKLMAGAWAWQAADGDDGPDNSVLRFGAAPDGAGGKGLDHVDALSVHLYTYRFDPNSLINELRNYDKLFAKSGYPSTMRRYVTETGAWDPGKFTQTTPPMDEKVRIMKRWCLIPAALGYSGVYLYKHSTLGTMGDPANFPEIATAITEMRNGLRGKRLEQAAVLADDTIWLKFEDGSSLRA